MNNPALDRRDRTIGTFPGSWKSETWVNRVGADSLRKPTAGTIKEIEKMLKLVQEAGMSVSVAKPTTEQDAIERVKFLKQYCYTKGVYKVLADRRNGHS